MTNTTITIDVSEVHGPILPILSEPFEIDIYPHKLSCDEYHCHAAPKCCANDCWCKGGIKPSSTGKRTVRLVGWVRPDDEVLAIKAMPIYEMYGGEGLSMRVTAAYRAGTLPDSVAENLRVEEVTE